MTLGFFVMAAFFEIAGCFAFWSYFRLGWPA
jgi:drug/metabolite transporter superfamily protein YnfA